MPSVLSLVPPTAAPLAQAMVFRVASAAVATIAAVTAAIAIAFAWLAWRGTVPIVIAGWIVLWLGLFALFYANDWRKALSPRAWLAAVAADGLYIKYRSYRNAAWSDADPQVVFIPYDVIATARTNRRTWLTPERRSGANRAEPVTYVELSLPDVDLTGLLERLAAERAGKPGRTASGLKIWRHFPVSVEPGDILRIEWRARPGAAAFLDALSAHGVAIERAVATRADLHDPNREQIDELARRGNVIDLIRVLRQNANMRLEDAKAEAERLIKASARDS